ncbi:hypothetical protein F511_35542 [Dorcoceras hygrometricum]|uniref:Uncharacterized protein n=1 Tax=Dorcoceras hygrometricum TaxID=472368 RepID=A0A2Z7CMP6_9LAMI|nr:hypothetical protein F511_35542 [Dorcoceras hygrometricum]
MSAQAPFYLISKALTSAFLSFTLTKPPPSSEESMKATIDGNRAVRGRLSWTGRRYLAETVRGRPSWLSSLLSECREHQAGSSAWSRSSTKIKRRVIKKSRVQVQNVEVQISVLGKTESEHSKCVLADGLDEVSEWIKRTSKHTMALDEKNRAELRNDLLNMMNSWLRTGQEQLTRANYKISKSSLLGAEKPAGRMIYVRSLISQMYQPAVRKSAGNGTKLVNKLRASKQLKSRKEQNKLSCRQKEAHIQNSSRAYQFNSRRRRELGTDQSKGQLRVLNCRIAQVQIRDESNQLEEDTRWETRSGQTSSDKQSSLNINIRRPN